MGCREVHDVAGSGAMAVAIGVGFGRDGTFGSMMEVVAVAVVVVVW